MSDLYNSEYASDLYLKIVQGAGGRFEVRVVHFFSQDESQPPSVTVCSDRHLQWEGRELRDAESALIRQAVALIDIRSAPAAVTDLNGDCYRLEVKGGKVFVRYEWWGSIPPEWHTLGPLVEALRVLAIPK